MCPHNARCTLCFFLRGGAHMLSGFFSMPHLHQTPARVASRMGIASETSRNRGKQTTLGEKNNGNWRGSAFLRGKPWETTVNVERKIKKTVRSVGHNLETSAQRTKASHCTGSSGQFRDDSAGQTIWAILGCQWQLPLQKLALVSWWERYEILEIRY